MTDGVAAGREPATAVTGWRGASSRSRVAVMAALAVVVGAAVGLGGAWELAPLAGWDAAALFFSASVWISVGRLSPAQTAAHATRENPSRGASDLVVVLAAVVSLAAVAVVLISGNSSNTRTKVVLAVLALFSVAVSWVTVQTLFTLRYALLYYIEPVGGIDFNSEEQPRYADFGYFSFNLGMTYQVSDNALRSTRLRKAVLRHCLISYLFGSVILATTVNVVVSLTSSGGSGH